MPRVLACSTASNILLETQRPDGSWDESLATGTGFPKVFYLNYHMYKDYFPLLGAGIVRKDAIEGITQ